MGNGQKKLSLSNNSLVSPLVLRVSASVKILSLGMFSPIRWILVLFTCISFSGNAQNPEIGLMGGGMYYLGDLNPLSNFKCTHLTGTLFFRMNPGNRLNYRFQVSYGNVSGADSLSSNDFTKNRNLSFKSPITEVSTILEINFVPFVPGDKKKFYATPYLMFGLGIFKMNPQAELNGNWFDLQSLGTEGQGSKLSNEKKYRLTQPVIPVGIGFKGNLSKRFIIGFEYLIRKTFTDYLDDVSGDYVDPVQLARLNGPIAAAFADRSLQAENTNNTGLNRGNSAFKDWYATANIYLAIRLGKDGDCYNWKRNK